MSIDTRDLGQIDGFDLTARLEMDIDVTPDEFDCYDAEAVEAWKRDDWHYVSTIITASKAGVELGTASLGGSEYGNLPGVDHFVSPLAGDGDEFVNGYGPQMIQEAIDEAKATLARLMADTPT